MKCQKVEQKLDDFVENALSERKMRHIKEHLQGCPNCEKIHQEITQLKEQLSSLSRRFGPEKELWYGIHSRIQRSRIQERRGPALSWSLRRVIPVVVSAVLILGLAMYTWLQPFPVNVPKLGWSQGQSGTYAQTVALKRFDQIEREYMRIKEEMFATVRSMEDVYDQELIELMERNFAVIDKAVEEIKTALDQYPDSTDLLLRLAEANVKRLDILFSVQELFVNL